MNNNGSKEPYEDPSLSPARRVRDLVSRMTLPQKAYQMDNSRTDAISELGIKEYYWWMEALHGIWYENPASTQFPQNIGIAATWDLDLIEEIYSAISDECRAFYNGGYITGLNYYSPAVLGVMRDKRWQRCEESFGEDPFLISQLAARTYKAFQGFGESKYLKAIATAKHFVSNRGPLGRDHPYAEFSGPASERITREVCFEPYKAAIREGYVGEFMSAYSGRPTGLDWNGNPCAASHLLLTEILRDEWHFKGHVTSDCWALWQIIESEGYSDEEVISEAVRAGVDLVCGRDYAE
ncbi:MAG: glycoside hydrolase family 3 N-terminal domain-containing protein, partial [bacterium]